MVINGTTSFVPEPSALAFGGLVCGILGISKLNSRRKTRS